MPDKEHKKQSAKEAISKEQSTLEKYSPEQMRAHMSTGGGEPIKPGHKWTTEHRVLQPRDPDTGHFTYNADAQLGLKYPQRAKGAIPVGAKGWILSNGITKGDKVVIDDKVWVAIDSIDKDTVVNYFKRYDEEAGEYVAEKDGKYDKFSSNFIRKRGRASQEEKAGIASGEKVIGAADLSSLGKYSQQEMASKFADKAKDYTPSTKNSTGIAKISASKLAANQAFNAKQAPSKQPAPNFAGAGASSATSAPQTQPKPTSPTQTQQPSQASSQPNKTSSSNPNKVVFSTKNAKGLSSAANKLGGILGGLNKNNKKSQDSSLLDDLDLDDLGI